MSIKSQKSLNDECSEIFEKSYSVRSLSDDSLSCSDEEECLAQELLHKLTPAALSKLRRCFKKSRGSGNDIDRRVEEVMRQAAAEEGIEFPAPAPAAPQPPALCLDRGGFVNAINTIFGDRRYSAHAHQLFTGLDPLATGRASWAALLGKLLAAGARRSRPRDQRWAPARPGALVCLDHCKRETIVKLVSIEREDSFCYAAVSKGGRVGVYSGQLKLLNSYEVFYHRTGQHSRVKNRWITDAIYLCDVQSLMLSASDRSLTVYDVSTLTHAAVCCVTGLPDIPTCLAYQPARRLGEPSELVLGTERGDLIRIRFLQPRVSLFHTHAPDNINYYFWMELPSPPHSSYCSISTWRKVHSRTVRRVCLVRGGDIVVSCSHDAAVSARARHLPGKLDDYIFKVARGISCFHVVSSLHLLAAGSADGVVRLWDTTQASPFASLAVPSSPAVLDVAVIASEEIVVAYCCNCTIHIWDLYEECLLQTVKVKFPFQGVLGKRVEFGAYCIHPGPPRRKPSDEEPQDDVSVLGSRRGSSVYRGSTGGLILQTEPDGDGWERNLLKEPEYVRFNRAELLVTCCDCVFTLVLRPPEGTALAPPGDTLRARRPSHWELPSDLLGTNAATPAPNPRPTPPPQLLAPEAAVYPGPPQDIEQLLENAGLQGILEKDFVLMQGLKHDLNRKVNDMQSHREATRAAVSAGAPYLALRSFEPDPLPTFDHLADRCARVVRLFPGPSVAATPSGSDASTPRNKTFKL